MPSELYRAGNENHFLTERFDRLAGGEKLHTQTLHALSPSAKDYINLFWLCDKLKVRKGRKDMLFRQMVFNYFSGVSDDHSKNFSFVMDRNGKWDMSPAYDLMFTSNVWADASASTHSLGVWNKRSALTKEDFVDFGEDLDLHDCAKEVDRIAEVVSSFPDRCRRYGISSEWSERIWKVIRGFLPPPAPSLVKSGMDLNVRSAVAARYPGKEVLFGDSSELKTSGKSSGRLYHLTVDGKKRTVVTDRLTGDICISPGHIRKFELYMGSWRTIDGKPAVYTSSRVLSLKHKNDPGLK